MTEHFENALEQQLNELQQCLTLPFVTAQLWSLDDLGFHQVLGPHIGGQQIKEMVRKACFQLNSTYQNTISVHPFTTENNMCATLLLHWGEPLTDNQHRINQQLIRPFVSELKRLLTTRRWSRLSGSAQQADQLGKVISLALEIESSIDINKTYQEIHLALSKLMYAENFFVARLSEDKEDISFDYYVDQYDTSNAFFKLRDGLLYGSLTAFVLASKRLLRGSSNELLLKMGYEYTNKAEELYGFGALSHDWLGVPMLVGNKVIGAVVVQSYDSDILFKDADPALILLLAETLATSLHSRQYREQLEKEIIQKTSSLADTNVKLESFIEQLQTSKKKLVEAEKQAALGRLVTGMAHELNTPLGICTTAVTNIAVTSQQTSDMYTSGKLTQNHFTHYFADVGKASHLIQSSLQRADKLVRKFKQLSPKMDPRRDETFNIAEILEEMRITSQHKYSEQNKYRIELNCHQNIAVTANKSAMRHLLEQLIDNSIEHAFNECPLGVISISCFEENGYLNLQYQDNGSGISKEIAKNIFDPFFTTARDRGHAGIGLHLVFNIVTMQLNGYINLNNTSESGAIFSITIPINYKEIGSPVDFSQVKNSNNEYGP
jgi:signal transduction histidine kinase